MKFDPVLFAKAISDETRQKIMNICCCSSISVNEIVEKLDVSQPTVSHHLAILTQAGLLTSRKDQYYQTYSLVGDALKKTLAEMVYLPQTGLAESVVEDAYRKKVLQTFMRLGRLVSIPAQLKKRQIVLERVAEEFEYGREYSEREVNVILLDFHDDVASLRRGLIELGLLERARGVYRRKAQPNTA